DKIKAKAADQKGQYQEPLNLNRARIIQNEQEKSSLLQSNLDRVQRELDVAKAELQQRLNPKPKSDNKTASASSTADPILSPSTRTASRISANQPAPSFSSASHPDSSAESAAAEEPLDRHNTSQTLRQRNNHQPPQDKNSRHRGAAPVVQD